MRICHLSMTPVAGACWTWSEAFKEAGYDSFCVCPAGYGDGRAMPRDEDWPPGEREIDMIRAADLIIAYQGHPYKMGWYPRDKPTIAVYVSQPHHVHRQAEHDGWPWGVIGEYQTRLYPGSFPVPNLIPLRHPWFFPADKPADRVRIVYSPSNRTQEGWDDKGFSITYKVLGGMPDDVEPVTIMGRPLHECLRHKATAHIVIDECVTGSYHGNSMQGLAAGCVVVNACDDLCGMNIRRMTGGCNHPFVVSNLSDLDRTLRTLIVRGPKKLAEMGASNRRWLEKAFGPAECINRCWKPLMGAALEKAGVG